MSVRYLSVSCCLLLALFLGFLSSDSQVAGKGKPPNDDPPPPVQYRVDEITGMDRPDAINYWGMVVGEIEDEGYMSDPVDYDMPYNLNEEVGYQLDALVGEQGWSIASANDINDFGDIVGSVLSPDYDRYSGNGGYVIAYVIETLMSTDPADWTLTLLPSHGSNRVSGLRINDYGDVLARYRRTDGTIDLYLFNPWEDTDGDEQTLDLVSTGFGEINNSGQVAGIYTPGTVFLYDATFQTLELIDINSSSTNPQGVVYGLNDFGHFVGSARIDVKNFTESTIYRYTTKPETIATHGVNSGSDNRRGINNDGDVFYRKEAKKRGESDSFLVHDGQTWNLNDLVAEDSIWLNATSHSISSMTERNLETGFPQLVGRIDFPSGERIGVVLTPVIPNP